MSVIVKKDKKISVVVNLLGDSFSPDEFVSKFQELYPKDWGRVENSYQEQGETTLGENHPMSKSTQYLKRALHAWQKKVEKNIQKDIQKDTRKDRQKNIKKDRQKNIQAVVGLNANAEKPIEQVNPNDILYSMPTISGDKIEYQIPTEKSFEGAPQFHEDEWCQLEFYQKSRLEELQKTLTKYKEFELQNRTASGWKNIFSRESVRSKFEFGGELLMSLPNAVTAPSPILTTSSMPLGQVKHGFTIKLGDSAILYGIEQDNKVLSLGASVYSDTGNQLLTNSYIALSKSSELVLVDWRAQMIIVGSSNGEMQVWKP